MNKYPIWLLSGRDANAMRKGQKSKIKQRPWKAGEFDTPQEAEAFRKGIIAAIGGALRNVAFISSNEAQEIDANIVKRLKNEYPFLNIKPLE